MHMMPRLTILALIALVAVPVAAQAPPRIFVFDQPFWLNLHHFLYVLGRAEAQKPDMTRRAVAGAPADQEAGLAQLAEGERQAWRDSVTAYARGLSQRDAVFDEEMISASQVLLAAGTATSVSGLKLDAATATALDRAAPIYRKVWWPKHDGANQRRLAEIQRWVAQYGQQMLAYITRAYQQKWPAAGYPVHMAAYTNWAGAYSTRGQLLMVSSLDEGLEGGLGLEIVFHEAMHQWDDPMFERLRAAAKRVGTPRVPGNLSHAMIFFTAGEAARSIVPGHTPYAEAQGLWKGSGLGAFRTILDREWKPYLDGNGSLEAALDALLRDP